MDQRSAEWYTQKLGRISGTRFAAAMGSNKRKCTLANTLIYERGLLKQPTELQAYIDKQMGTDFKAGKYGRENEDKAIAMYELLNDVAVSHAGFVIHPEHNFIGVSPDGYLEDRVIEVKCPMSSNDHGYALHFGIPEQYIPQVQGNTWVLGKLKADYLSFDIRQHNKANALKVVPAKLDKKFINNLEQSCIEINKWVVDGNVPRETSDIPDLF